MYFRAIKLYCKMCLLQFVTKLFSAEEWEIVKEFVNEKER